jgi:hypothetical protein
VLDGDEVAVTSTPPIAVAKVPIKATGLSLPQQIEGLSCKLDEVLTRMARLEALVSSAGECSAQADKVDKTLDPTTYVQKHLFTRGDGEEVQPDASKIWTFQTAMLSPPAGLGLTISMLETGTKARKLSERDYVFSAVKENCAWGADDKHQTVLFVNKHRDTLGRWATQVNKSVYDFFGLAPRTVGAMIFMLALRDDATALKVLDDLFNTEKTPRVLYAQLLRDVLRSVTDSSKKARLEKVKKPSKLASSKNGRNATRVGIPNCPPWVYFTVYGNLISYFNKLVAGEEFSMQDLYEIKHGPLPDILDSKS